MKTSHTFLFIITAITGNDLRCLLKNSQDALFEMHMMEMYTFSYVFWENRSF